MVSFEIQKIDLDGVSNARQLGGYIGANGRKIKNNTILRTGTLWQASDKVCSILCEKYNLGDIIDLRMNNEANLMPDPDIENAAYHHISVLNNIPITKDDFRLYKELLRIPDVQNKYKQLYSANIDLSPVHIYRSMVFGKESIEGFKKYFSVLLNKKDDTSVLFHCTQGKDRTGLAAIFLLSALGVDKETIAADYMLTNIACKSLLDNIRSGLENKVEKEILDFALFLESVNMDFIDPVLAEIDKEYGSINGYLMNVLGLRNTDIKRLKELYLD